MLQGWHKGKKSLIFATVSLVEKFSDPKLVLEAMRICLFCLTLFCSLQPPRLGVAVGAHRDGL